MTFPPPPTDRADRTNRLLLGCGLGCLALVMIAAALAGVAYFKVVKPVASTVQGITVATQEAEAARAAVADLDGTHPWERGDDLALVDLTASDVDRYVAVRRELAARFQAVADARAAVTGGAPDDDGKEPTPGEMFSMISGMVMGGKAMLESQRDLFLAAKPALDEAGMGPAEFEALASIVEWRFLQRPEALALGLPSWRREDLLEERMSVAFTEPWLRGAPHGGPMGDKKQVEEMRANVERSRERIAELEAEARENVALSPATRALLEARRAELDALPTEGASALDALTTWPEMPSHDGPGVKINTPP